MEQIVLNAKKRDTKSKETNNKLRSEGRVPAMYYGPGRENIALELNAKELGVILRKKLDKHIINLNIDGVQDDDDQAIIKEIQKDPVKEFIYHVDFLHVSKGKKMVAKVPIEIIGTAKGVKTGGGMLEILMRSIEIECLPKDLPDNIEVDVSDLDLGHSFHVSDLKFTDIKPLSHPEDVIATVTVPRAKKEKVSAGKEEKVAEPEVVNAKGKKEEGDEGK